MPRSSSKGREFWKSALDRQRTSGLSVAAFCREESLSDKTFYLWRRKLQGDESQWPPEKKFTELVLDEAAGSGPKVELTLRDGTRLVVSEITSDDQLARVLSVLRARA